MANLALNQRSCIFEVKIGEAISAGLIRIEKFKLTC